MEISAKMARKKAEEVKEIASSGQMIEIMAVITEATNKGEFTVCYYNPISQESGAKLNDLGYKVEYESHRNESHTRISW